MHFVSDLKIRDTAVCRVLQWNWELHLIDSQRCTQGRKRGKMTSVEEEGHWCWYHCWEKEKEVLGRMEEKTPVRWYSLHQNRWAADVDDDDLSDPHCVYICLLLFRIEYQFPTSFFAYFKKKSVNMTLKMGKGFEAWAAHLIQRKSEYLLESFAPWNSL